MSRSLELSFQSASAKYARLNKKIKKSIARGEFWRFTTRKRNHLIARIEKLRKRLIELRTQIKFATAGIAAASLLGITTAEAQVTPIGPFVFNPAKNPLPAPAFDKGYTYPEAQYRDFDGDGDLDAIVTFEERGFDYYENVGNSTSPSFLKDRYNYRFNFYLPTNANYTYNPSHATYADLDDDGDQDMVALAFRTNYSDFSPVYLFENTGGVDGYPNPYFTTRSSELPSPFPGNLKTYGGWPTFADIDGDGDKDLIVSGGYYDEVSGKQNYIQYFRNEKNSNAAGQWPTFKQLEGSENPLQINTNDSYAYVGVSFADIDGDGDQDFFYTLSDGTIHYKRNDSGVFTEQDGAWQYNSANPGASTGNPFAIAGLNQLGAVNNYKAITFADLDGDGDLDATMALNIGNTSQSVNPFFYFENTNHGTFTRVQGIDRISGVRVGGIATSSLFDWDGDNDLDIVAVSNNYTGTGCTENSCSFYKYQIEPTVFLFDGQKFSPPSAIGVNPLPTDITQNSQVQYIDVDGDADLDLLISRQGDGYQELYYYEKNGSNWIKHSTKDGNNPFSFAEDSSFPSSRPAMADLNGDGKPDLILSEYYNPPKAYENTGTVAQPEFTYNESWNTELSNGGYPYSSNNPALVDMDADGDFDLVISKYNNVWYYKNEGDPTTPDFVFYDTKQNAGDNQVQYWGQNPFGAIDFNRYGSLNLADVDGDGDKDLLYLSQYENSFEYYENQNPAPVVDVNTTALQFTRNSKLKLATDFTIEDQDDDKIVKITVTVTPYTKGQETLSLAGTHGNLTAQFDDVKGQLTITGNDTIPVWQEALNNIEYIFTGPAAARTGKAERVGKIVTKSITVTTLDADLTVAPSNTTTFTATGDDGTGPGNVTIIAPHKTASPGGNVVIVVTDVASTTKGELDLSTVAARSEQGVVSISNGIVTIDYKNKPTFTGTDIVTLSVCDTNGECASQDIQVKIDSQIFIYTGMSPNGDNVNDWFHIDFLPDETQVAIYNRWGEIIYEENNYNVDDPKRRFEGVNKNGTEVIAGTYYYKVKLKSDSKAKSGYLLISR